MKIIYKRKKTGDYYKQHSDHYSFTYDIDDASIFELEKIVKSQEDQCFDIIDYIQELRKHKLIKLNEK